MWPCVYCPARTMGELISFSLWFSARAVRCFQQAAKTFLILAPCGEQRRPWTVRSPPSSRLLSPFTHQSDESERPLVLSLVRVWPRLPLQIALARLRSLCACNQCYIYLPTPKNI